MLTGITRDYAGVTGAMLTGLEYTAKLGGTSAVNAVWCRRPFEVLSTVRVRQRNHDPKRSHHRRGKPASTDLARGLEPNHPRIKPLASDPQSVYQGMKKTCRISKNNSNLET